MPDFLAQMKQIHAEQDKPWGADELPDEGGNSFLRQINNVRRAQSLEENEPTAWRDESLPMPQRIGHFLDTHLEINQPFNEVAEKAKGVFGTDIGDMRKGYERVQEQRRTQEHYQGFEEGAGGFIARRSVPVFSAGVQFGEALAYKHAKERVDKGEEKPGDFDRVAMYEKLQADEANKSTGEAILSGVARVPAFLGEAWLGGAALKGLGVVGTTGLGVGRGAATLAEAAAPSAGMKVASWLGRNAAQTALMPSMYLPQTAQRAVENGGNWYSAENLGPAYVMGNIQVGLLGLAGQGAQTEVAAGIIPGVARGGIAGWMTRLMTGTGAAMAGQEAVDVTNGILTSAWPKWGHKSYGLVSDVMDGKEGTAKHFLTQLVTYGIFSAVHAHHNPVGAGRAQAAADAKAVMDLGSQFVGRLKAMGYGEDAAYGEAMKAHKVIMEQIQGKDITGARAGLNRMAQQYVDALGERVGVDRLAAEQKAADQAPDPVKDPQGAVDAMGGNTTMTINGKTYHANPNNPPPPGPVSPAVAARFRMIRTEQLAREAVQNAPKPPIPEQAPQVTEPAKAPETAPQARFTPEVLDQMADTVAKSGESPLEAVKRLGLEPDAAERVMKRVAELKAQAKPDPNALTPEEVKDVDAAMKQHGLKPDSALRPMYEGAVLKGRSAPRGPQVIDTLEGRPSIPKPIADAVTESLPGAKPVERFGKTIPNEMEATIGGRRFSIEHDADRNVVRIDFTDARPEKAGVGRNVEKGSLEVMRGLRSLISKLKGTGADVEYTALDAASRGEFRTARAELYARMMEKAGYELVEKPGPDSPTPTYRWRAKSESQELSRRSGLPALRPPAKNHVEAHARYMAAREAGGNSVIGRVSDFVREAGNVGRDLSKAVGDVPVYMMDSSAHPRQVPLGAKGAPIAEFVITKSGEHAIILNRQARFLTPMELSEAIGEEAAHAARAKLGRSLTSDLPYNRQPFELSAKRAGEAVGNFLVRNQWKQQILKTGHMDEWHNPETRADAERWEAKLKKEIIREAKPAPEAPKPTEVQGGRQSAADIIVPPETLTQLKKAGERRYSVNYELGEINRELHSSKSFMPEAAARRESLVSRRNDLKKQLGTIEAEIDAITAEHPGAPAKLGWRSPAPEAPVPRGTPEAPKAKSRPMTEEEFKAAHPEVLTPEDATAAVKAARRALIDAGKRGENTAPLAQQLQKAIDARNEVASRIRQKAGGDQTLPPEMEASINATKLTDQEKAAVVARVTDSDGLRPLTEKMGVSHETVRQRAIAGLEKLKESDPELWKDVKQRLEDLQTNALRQRAERQAGDPTHEPDPEDPIVQHDLESDKPRLSKLTPEEVAQELAETQRYLDDLAKPPDNAGAKPAPVQRQDQPNLRGQAADSGPEGAAEGVAVPQGQGDADASAAPAAVRGEAPRRQLTQPERMAAIKKNIKPLLEEAKQEFGPDADILVHDRASNLRAQDKAKRGDLQNAWDRGKEELDKADPGWNKRSDYAKVKDFDLITNRVASAHRGVLGSFDPEAGADHDAGSTDHALEAAEKLWAMMKAPRPGLTEPQAYEEALKSLRNERAEADAKSEAVRRGETAAALEAVVRRGRADGEAEAAAEEARPESAGDLAHDVANPNLDFDPAEFGRPLEPGERFGISGGQEGEGPVRGRMRETALAFEQVDAEREVLGLKPILKDMVRADKEVWAKVRSTMAQDPSAGERLVNNLSRAPRPVTIDEAALLLFRRVQLQNAHERVGLELVKAFAEKAPKAEQDALAAKERQLADLIDQTDLAARHPAAEAGRVLRWQRVIAKEDFTLSSMLRQASVVRGRALTEAESAQVAEMSKRIADLEAQLGHQRVGAKDVSTDLTRLQQKWKADLNQARWQQKPLTERAQDLFSKWRRASILSSPVIIGKLTSAALARFANTPVEEGVGGLWGRLLPSVAAKAKLEAGLNFKAEVRALSKAFTDGMKDAWDVLKTGKSELKVKYGTSSEGESTFARFLEIPGRIHGALKAPVARAAFERAVEKLSASAIRDGLDPADPAVSTRIMLEAYKASERSIFMQDNRVSDAYQRGIRYLERPDLATGRVPGGAKAIATGMKFALPIVKVPTNIVAETFTNAFGLVTGSFQLGRAYARGIESLTPEQADVIMRSLKKGSLGAAVLALGFLNPDSVGGYYQHGQRRKDEDAEAGGLKIGGVQVPKYLVHNPLLETAQIGATVRRAIDSKAHKKDAENQSYMMGMMRALLGLLEEVPFVRETVEVSKAYENPEKFAGTQLKSAVVPAGVSWTAEQLDRQDVTGPKIKREAKTPLQEVQSGVPVLRQRLPVKYGGRRR